jgi:hypothetical protein
MILGLWSSDSITRSSGTEALESGYRSPARRIYGELVYLKHAQGRLRPSEEEICARLTAAKNYVEASPVVEA